MTPDASCIPVLSAQLIIPNRTSVASNTVGLRLPQDRPSPFTRVDTLLRQPRGFRWRESVRAGRDADCHVAHAEEALSIQEKILCAFAGLKAVGAGTRFPVLS